jgi:hypothetical protein
VSTSIQVFLLILFVLSSFIFPFKRPFLLCSSSVCQIRLLNCSDYLHYFGLHPVTVAIWRDSFVLYIFNVLLPTMVYAASFRYDLRLSLAKFYYSF